MHQTDVNEAAAIKASVEQIRGSLTGELIGRPEAIDHLLDLRSVVKRQPALVNQVDVVLRDVPGQRTVATAWLGVVLTDMERLVSSAAPDQNWSSVMAPDSGRDNPPPPRHRAGSI